MCGIAPVQLPEFTPDPVQLELVTASTGTVEIAATLLPLAFTACGKLTGIVAHTPFNCNPLLVYSRLPLGEFAGIFGTSLAGTTTPTDPVSTVYDAALPPFTSACTVSVDVRFAKFGDPTHGTV
jgi:hypothetical protein